MPLAASQIRDVGRPTFDLATSADDAEVRRLYRENPMGGAIRLSLEREPDASLAAGVEGDVHQAVVARRPGGGLAAVGTRSVRTAHVNGRPTRLGYLGGLRVDADQRNDPRLLLRGYARLRDLHESAGDCRLYLTSVVADNAAARRVLEAGLRGMPTYRFVGEFVTLTMTPRRATRRSNRRLGRDLRVCREWTEDCRNVVDLHRGGGPALQFAPVWTTALLCSPASCRGLSRDHFRVAYREGMPVGCAALWDQRSVKQAVVRGYGPAVSRVRPWANLAARLTGRPRLPAIGFPLRAAFASHMTGELDVVVRLLTSVHRMASRRSVDYLIVGFDAADPRLAAVRRAFGGHELRTRLYVVHWPDGAADAAALDGRLLGPEAALL